MDRISIAINNILNSLGRLLKDVLNSIGLSSSAKLEDSDINKRQDDFKKAIEQGRKEYNNDANGRECKTLGNK